ncbi:MAG: DUF1800 domain-containing protein [Cytophagales bacterium]|nr:MAG: DUF1800 domain-containing protein [Cytophagales bacterium]
MPYLDLFTTPLTAKTAAHLLRRATFGPTQGEITAFTGQTATQAVQTLITNSNYNPPQPVDLDSTRPTAGQPYLRNSSTPAGQYLPFDGDRNFDYGLYIKYWWIGQMIGQSGTPNLLDKLTLFWQNHFVTTRETVDDYRFVWSYLILIRNNALGNFRDLVTKMTKEPAMLRFLNGDMNEVGAGKANENYARELQELFTMGTVDPDGNANYTEDDVKAAARVLTGWKYTNHWNTGSTTFTTTFTANKHDTGTKTFSGKYNGKIISTPTTVPAGFANVGEYELNELITMMLAHPQTSRFICRKLYRWYVNANVTPDIETNVVIPLGALLVSSNWNIRPVVEKLLTSQIFFDAANIGAMVKSPADLLLGTTRFFNQPLPALPASVAPYKTLSDFLHWRMRDLQLDLMDQPTVFGYDAFYQTGYSRNWINTTTMALRNDFTDALIWRWLTVDAATNYKYGIDLLAWVTGLQSGFGNITTTTSTPPGTPPITCVVVLDAFLLNLFATDLAQTQKDFLIDKIMMMDQSPRTTWEFEWNQYRRTVTYPASYSATQIKNARDTINWRLQTLMRYLLRMAEYHLV